MKFHVVFVITAIAMAWAALLYGNLGLFWVRSIGILLGFFGFLFIIMLSDNIDEGIRAFGADLIVIGIALMIIWA